MITSSSTRPRISQHPDHQYLVTSIQPDKHSFTEDASLPQPAAALEMSIESVQFEVTRQLNGNNNLVSSYTFI